MKTIRTITDQNFNRAPRVRQPLPSGEVEIPSPPTRQQAPSTSWWSILLPVLGVGLFVGISAAGGGDPTLMLASGAMMLVSVGVSVANYLQQRKKYQIDDESRSDAYAKALKKVEKQLKHARNEQQQGMLQVDPDAEECLRRVVDLAPTLWERRPQDDDFLALRIGTGEASASLKIKHHKPPAVMTAEHDPKLHNQAIDLGDKYSVVPDVPVTVNLPEVGVLGIAGPPPSQHALLRAMLCSLVAHHSPDEVKLITFLPHAQADYWAWLRWLPHVHAQMGGQSRWIATNSIEHKRLAGNLAVEWSQRKIAQDYSKSSDETPLPRYVLLIVDQEAMQQSAVSQVLVEGAELGAYAICLGPDRPHLPKHCGAILEVSPGEAGRYTVVGKGTPQIHFEPDKLVSELPENLARALAPIQPVKAVASDSLPDVIRILELHGANRVEELPVWENWEQNKIFEKIEAPIGVRVGGHLMQLNLWENIHGPNGLVAGTVGSGKTEMLHTLVASLAIRYHPHDLNFALVDFKGGGLTKDLDELPHVVGSVTNLEPGMARRALETIKSEILRREALLKGRHIKEYQQSFHAQKEKIPIPRLIVIIDEFAELASEEPDFLENLISAARLGRSLGIHLILATQKPAGVVKGQIWSNSRFRICMRVETTEDSQDMLHRTDAITINKPGRAYLQVGDNEVYELIQIGRSGATYVAGDMVVSSDADIAKVRVDGRRELIWPPPDPNASTVQYRQSTTDIQAIVRYVKQIAEKHNIKRLPGPWLPILPKEIGLEALRAQSIKGGWDGKGWKSTKRWLNPIVGTLDDTTHQKQPPLFVNLGERGHLFLCGGMGSGKSTFLCTMVASLVHDHSPEELNFYLLDYGGRGMDVFDGLPHVGAVLHPGEEEVVERLFRWLCEEVERRNTLMGDAPNLLAYRQNKGAEILPAIVVVIDGYATLTEAFDGSQDYIQKLARGGQSVGIHLVVAADRPGALTTRAATNFNMRLAFYFPERSDYSLVVGKSPTFPMQAVPGRGLWMGDELLVCQIASLQSDQGNMGSTKAVRDKFKEIGKTWKGVRAHPMRELSKQVALSELLQRWRSPKSGDGADSLAVPVGLDALRLEPVVLDLVQTGPHFLIAGHPQSGRTSALKTYLSSLAATYSPDQVQFWLVDCFQPGLQSLKDLPHTHSYAGMEDEALRLIDELGQVLRGKRRSSKKGDMPRIVLAMDDYDFFEASSAKDQLRSLARKARAIGFHILMAGAASELRTGFDELRRQILTSRCGMLLSSASEDGQIFNVRVPISEGAFPPGRGYLIRRNQPSLVQWALHSNKS